MKLKALTAWESSPRVPKEEKTSLVSVISALALIVAAGVSLLGSSASIPREAFYLLAVGVLLLAVVLFLGLLYKPLALYLRQRRLIREDDALARKHFKEFHGYVEEFKETYNPRQQNITTPIMGLRGRGGDFAKIPEVSPMYIETLCDQLLRALALMKPSKETLVWGSQTFLYILRMFNDNLLRPAVTDIRAIADQKGLPRDVKEDYNTLRLKYIRFLDNYEGFIVRANKEFGPSRPLRLPGDFGSLVNAVLWHPYIERPKEL